MTIAEAEVAGPAAQERVELADHPLAFRRGEPQDVALDCAKLLALEDTVLYGRTLLMQANARSAVLHADAMLQQPIQVPQGAALG